MNENTHRNWDIRFKWFGLVGILAGGFWTVVTYNQGRTKEQNNYIFEHQASLYLDAARVSATIAIGLGPSPDERKEIDQQTLQEAEERFEQLYYGELVIVEDHRVELAMIAFRDCWQSNGANCERHSHDQFGNPIKNEVLAELPVPTLKGLALELAACTRSALQEDRKIKFGHVRSADTICPYD